MRPSPGVLLEKSRFRLENYWYEPGSFHGFFQIKNLRIIATPGDIEGADGWEHVSVSTAIRCPTWDEMCFVKALFWSDDECVMQLHPPKAQWISNHPYCLHLWKPPVAIPMPDPLMVGIKQDGEYKNRDEARAGYERAVARGDLRKYE